MLGRVIESLENDGDLDGANEVRSLVASLALFESPTPSAPREATEERREATIERIAAALWANATEQEIERTGTDFNVAHMRYEDAEEWRKVWVRGQAQAALDALATPSNFSEERAERAESELAKWVKAYNALRSILVRNHPELDLPDESVQPASWRMAVEWAAEADGDA